MALEKPTPDQNGDDALDDTLMADITAAIKGADDAVEGIDAPDQKEAPETPEAKPTGPARAPDGKFVAKTDQAAQIGSAAEVVAKANEAAAKMADAADGAPPAVRPPPGWSVEAKAAFNTLPDAVKDAVMKREEEVSNGFRQYSEKVKAFEGFEEVMRQPDPRGVSWGERLRAANETPVAAISRLLNAQAALERDPVAAIAWLAKDYGVDLRLYGAQKQGQPVLGPDGKPAPQHLQDLLQSIVQQAVAPYAQKIQTFEQGWQQRQEAERAQQEAALIREIEAFAADPKNVYFENVQGLMAQLITSGAAKDLPEAYQMAVYAHPETRQALINEQQAAALRERQANQQRVVSGAKKAAGSITGAPGNPADAGAPQGAPPDDLRAVVANAWNQAAGRV